MSVKIRLSRFGKKGNPFYRIIACDESNKRDGKFIEILGTYNPVADSQVTIKKERVEYWLKLGATPTNTAKSILKKQGIK